MDSPPPGFRKRSEAHQPAAFPASVPARLLVRFRIERNVARPAAFVIIVRRSFGYLATLEVEADFLSRLGETTQVGARRLHALGLKVE
jgi:hypothetical protein